MASQERELARKLAWAVNSTLSPPDSIKRRVRIWSWRVACKMVSAKSQFSIDISQKNVKTVLAGGGVAGVSNRAPARSDEEPRSPAPKESGDAGIVRTSTGLVWLECGHSGGSSGTCPAPGCRCSPWCRCRIGRFRGSASSDDRGGRDAAPAKAKACAYGGRHADGPYDCLCYLEEGR